jgi:hypothetical protein
MPDFETPEIIYNLIVALRHSGINLIEWRIQCLSEGPLLTATICRVATAHNMCLRLGISCLGYTLPINKKTKCITNSRDKSDGG